MPGRFDYSEGKDAGGRDSAWPQAPRSGPREVEAGVEVGGAWECSDARVMGCGTSPGQSWSLSVSCQEESQEAHGGVALIKFPIWFLGTFV